MDFIFYPFPIETRIPCNKWKGGDPTLPGWQLRIVYTTSVPDDTFNFSSSRLARVAFGFSNSNEEAFAKLTCDLSDHKFDDGDRASKYFSCKYRHF